MKRLTIICVVSIPLLFFVIGLFTIREYGINWDEPAHYLRGQSLLRYFLTGKKDYRDLPKLLTHYGPYTGEPLSGIVLPDDKTFRRSIYQFDRNGDQFTFYYWERQIGSHPPFNGLLASATNYLLYQKLGIAGDIESYHIFIVAISALLVLLVVYITYRWYGVFAGIISGLSLSLYPLFFAESHVNIKDPVEAAFYALTVYAFYKVVTTKKILWAMLVSISTAFALGTKFNIVFAPLTIGAWFICFLSGKKEKFNILSSPALWLSITGMIILPFVLLTTIWPSLWGNPLKGFFEVVGFYRDIGYGTTYQPSAFLTLAGLNTFPIRAVLYATPLITLFLALIGIVYVVRYGWKEKEKTSLLVLFWFLVPIVRVLMPHASIYAGVRQIMEYIPAMAILAGVGARYLVRRFKNSARCVQAVIIILFLPITLKMISMHPNENVYMNPLIGGLKGAQARNFPDWGVTLGTVYWQGVQWLNAHAEPNAKLTLAKGLIANVPRNQLRQDIQFLPTFFSGEKKEGEYIMEVVDYYWMRDVPGEKRAYLETIEPVFKVAVDDVTILMIWKNDPMHTKKRFLQ